MFVDTLLSDGAAGEVAATGAVTLESSTDVVAAAAEVGAGSARIRSDAGAVAATGKSAAGVVPTTDEASSARAPPLFPPATAESGIVTVSGEGPLSAKKPSSTIPFEFSST